VFTLPCRHEGTSLAPRDPALQVSMSRISPVLTKETTMWRCWMGFNASHSMGLILFGLIYAYLALAHDQLLFRTPEDEPRRTDEKYPKKSQTLHNSAALP
jgi:hypothetical protein